MVFDEGLCTMTAGPAASSLVSLNAVEYCLGAVTGVCLLRTHILELFLPAPQFEMAPLACCL